MISPRWLPHRAGGRRVGACRWRVRIVAECLPRFAPQLAGIELCDSWATDGHKWLNTPYDGGMAITRHGDALKAAMRMTATYLTEGGEYA